MLKHRTGKLLVAEPRIAPLEERSKALYRKALQGKVDNILAKHAPYTTMTGYRCNRTCDSNGRKEEVGLSKVLNGQLHNIPADPCHACVMMTRRFVEGYSSFLKNDSNGHTAEPSVVALLKCMNVESICNECGGYTYLKARASMLFSVLQFPEPAYSAVPQFLHHHIQHQCFGKGNHVKCNL
jgi:hypothetical protein